jgi:hypothetical protein
MVTTHEPKCFGLDPTNYNTDHCHIDLGMTAILPVTLIIGAL